MIALVASAVFIINIPFGFWRKTVRKLSLAWFVAIHVPVIISIALRYLTGIETQFLNILLFVSVFFGGQLAGKYSYDLYFTKKNRKINE